jgi:hypothetical protein
LVIEVAKLRVAVGMARAFLGFAVAGPAYATRQPVLAQRQFFFNAAANRARRNPGRRRHSGDAATSGRHRLRCRHQPPSPFVKERRHTVKALANQSRIDRTPRLCQPCRLGNPSQHKIDSIIP